MPAYRCPKCGRQIELPEGYYYCKVCGPSAIMIEADPDNEEIEVPRGFPEDIKRIVRLFVDGLRKDGFHVSTVAYEHAFEPYMDVNFKDRKLVKEMRELLPKSGFYPQLERWQIGAFAEEHALGGLTLTFIPPTFEVKGRIPITLVTAEKPHDFLVGGEIRPSEFPHISFDVIELWTFYGLPKVEISIYGSKRAEPTDVILLLEDIRRLILKARDISRKILKPPPPRPKTALQLMAEITRKMMEEDWKRKYSE